MSADSPIAVVSARELAFIVAEAISLEGVDPAQIDVSATLFEGGLGLDSLDMLEISLVIQQRFGIKLKPDDPDNEAIFASIQSLADHINAAQAAPR
jgi:acyl carrier protein